jgi:hypothetical protein
LRRRSTALARERAIALVVIVALVVGAGVYFLSSSQAPSTTQNNNVEIQIVIKETDPVNQIDNFVPANVTARLSQNVTIAVQNGDDEPRLFVLLTFGVNETIAAGTTGRVTFLASEAGTFKFTSTGGASSVSNGKPAQTLIGYLTVTP